MIRRSHRLPKWTVTATKEGEGRDSGLPFSIAGPELVARKMTRLKYSVAEMMNWNETRRHHTDNGIKSFIVGHYEFSHRGTSSEISPGKQRLEPTRISNQLLSNRCFSTESGKLLYRSEHRTNFKYGVSELRPKLLANNAGRTLVKSLFGAHEPK